MRVFGLLLALIFLAGGGYSYFQSHPERTPDWLLSRLPIASKPSAQPTSVNDPAPQPSPPPPPLATPEPAKPAPRPTSSDKTVTLYLKNGGVVTGQLLRETPTALTLRWDIGDVDFHRDEIRQLVTGKKDTDETDIQLASDRAPQETWPYRHDVVVKLMKGTVLDAAIGAVTPTEVVLHYKTSSGGEIEQRVARAEIEELLFKPVRNERSTKIADTLKALFPTMHWYEEGLVTIVTDSTPPTVKQYRRTIRELTTDWYLTFYRLVRQRAPAVQQHVVIFENWDSYMEYALTDGVPGWIAVGYFDPEDEVLYCFNVVGEKFSDLLSEAYLGQFRMARDQVSAQIKGRRYEEVIEGQISEFLQKLEAAHARIHQAFQDRGTGILRHELTHALFHDWGLQMITLSRIPEANRDEIAKKRKFLAADNIEEKRRILDELLEQKMEAGLPKLEAANSWLVEGLAGFMEPTPVGATHTERLAELQEAQKRNQILPMEFLNAFRIGSFRGMATQSALYAYAQSWALCHFLVHGYPEGFLAFQERMATQPPAEGEDTLAWLLQAIGKSDRNDLDQEFAAYLSKFEPEDPLWLKDMQEFLDLRAELTSLASRLWGVQ